MPFSRWSRGVPLQILSKPMRLVGGMCSGAERRIGEGSRSDKVPGAGPELPLPFSSVLSTASCPGHGLKGEAVLFATLFGQVVCR